MHLGLLSLGRSAQSPAAVPSGIMPDAREDEGSYCSKVPNILRFLVPVCCSCSWITVFILRAQRSSIRTRESANEF